MFACHAFAGGEEAADVVPAVVAAGSFILTFIARVLWGFVQFGVAGVVLTQVLPWQAVEFPGPLGFFLDLVYLALDVYASLLRRAAAVLLALLRAALRSPAPALAPGAAAAAAAPAWEALEREAQELLSREAFTPQPGLFNPSRTDLRLFGAAPTEAVRVVFWRDSASWCPYCMKTQLFLEECQIPYRVKWVNMSCYGDKTARFLQLNPGGLLPVAEIDGDVIADSDRIIRRLREWPEAARAGLAPEPEQLGREEERGLVRLAYDLQAAWLTWLRSPVNDSACRQAMEERLDLLEASLASGAAAGPFARGRFSLVECHLAPILERAAASLAYYKGFFIRQRPGPHVPKQGDGDAGTRWPHVQRWFEAMERRPSYRSLAGDFYTHAHDLPPQLGACARSGRGTACEAHVDGLEGSGAWLLPLPEVDPFEPIPAGALAAAPSDRAARLEAAEALLARRGPVASFALRALGRPGLPPARAALADPRAEAGEAEADRFCVDLALRHAAERLLHGEGASVAREDLSTALYAQGPDAVERWRECLRYLQQRVGVPRDMSAAAARQLRAHLGSICSA